MANAWLPRAGRMPTDFDCGHLLGGAPRVVWMIWEGDPARLSARSVAQRLTQLGRPVHLVWNPKTGEIRQILPITMAAGGLRDTAGVAKINREGRVCVQIVVIGSSRRPFTDGPLVGLDRILSWLDSWGVARHWPAGPPLPYPQGIGKPRSRRLWARGGHFAHSQVPEVDASDPGDVDIRRITGPQTPTVGVPKPRAQPPQRTEGRPATRQPGKVEPITADRPAHASARA